MNEARVWFENEYYKVIIGKSVMTFEYEGDIYQLVNKESNKIEYEEHLLPQIIGVAIQAAKGLVDFMEDKSPGLTVIQ